MIGKPLNNSLGRRNTFEGHNFIIVILLVFISYEEIKTIDW
jgi:hypothetical protein